ncbi:torsin-1A-interacting protein 2 isoform X2 [Coregonus clupeaformis]|uniref:torsin-1A-interacting protein 2 isoform X2 n=1 Tax=Coregonus clupeaformis TaxID=59861 RepID=UPI001BE070BD|nr:torsin-1A-interacting protein 2 isoform X2 [Coregonus clupeaformis]
MAAPEAHISQGLPGDIPLEQQKGKNDNTRSTPDKDALVEQSNQTQDSSLPSNTPGGQGSQKEMEDSNTEVKKQTEPSAAVMEQPDIDPEEKDNNAPVGSGERVSEEGDEEGDEEGAVEPRSQTPPLVTDQRATKECKESSVKKQTEPSAAVMEQPDIDPEEKDQDSSLLSNTSGGQGSQNSEDSNTEVKKQTEPSAAVMEQPDIDPEEKDNNAPVGSGERVSEEGDEEGDEEGAVEPRSQTPPLVTDQRATKERKESSGNVSKLMLAGFLAFLLAVAVNFFSSESLSEKTDFNRTEIFLREMKKVEAQFPGQRSELWRRSRIHLERHLQTAQPTEPVSLMLTAGRRGERTLHCLALRLANAVSSALNSSSILHIDGASKTGQDSDQVKLDIDTQLRDAFEGDQPVAVVYRFEELPPGSTIIFYRYCDHENAAYKEALLIFTVLLGGEEELPASLGLSAVEEMVDDHLQDRFLSSDQPAAYDMMDLDKFSGLWSRISHLVLPVAAEETIERRGCV